MERRDCQCHRSGSNRMAAILAFGADSYHLALSRVLSEPLKYDCIYDDVFQALSRHFHMSGKGRRPDLPQDLTLTNKLLLQLFILKEEGHESFRMLKAWLEKIVPDTVCLTESRMRRTIMKLLEACKQKSSDEICQFMEGQHDFFALEQPLSDLGLTRLHLTGTPEFLAKPTATNITNHVVVALDHFGNQEKLSGFFVALGEPRVAHPKSTHCRFPFSTGSFASPVEVFTQVWEHFMELVCSLSIPIPLPDRFDVSVYFGFYIRISN
ncbi:hypothetical protein PoB_004149200 [Plakobranchus ocellatus]|uniref:DUF4470 domain-containing protein n=1 Tax=Plakobranchus ocellatus TaxID=259542 RepID=A0AAV4B7B2_9GAST|nr:hypothetical protein PoB_004149200 [Plakobranchus ocellatus]